MLPLAGLAGIAFVGLGAIGIARAWDPLPLRDMWDGYLGFWYRLTSGDLEAMWAQYNEHRLILSRIAFVIDLAVFRGAGWFLIVANGAAALSIAAIFVSSLIVRLREGLHQTGTRLGLGLLSAIIVGLTTSWVQNQNLLWGFQIQFFLGVLLPLASFVAVAAARRDAPRRGSSQPHCSPSHRSAPSRRVSWPRSLRRLLRRLCANRAGGSASSSWRPSPAPECI
jgi:hypothetical protein